MSSHLSLKSKTFTTAYLIEQYSTVDHVILQTIYFRAIDTVYANFLCGSLQSVMHACQTFYGDLVS